VTRRVRFDRHTRTFDDAARMTIAATLPPGAAIDAVLAAIAEAAPNGRVGLKAERDRLRNDLKLFQQLAASLRRPHSIYLTGDPKQMRRMLAEPRKRTGRLVRTYDAIVASLRGQDIARELFYRQLILIWFEAGGSLNFSRSSATGGACADFLATTLVIVTGKRMTVGGVCKIIARYRDYAPAEPSGLYRLAE
jgi:hypothetical protein